MEYGNALSASVHTKIFFPNCNPDTAPGFNLKPLKATETDMDFNDTPAEAAFRKEAEDGVRSGVFVRGRSIE